MTMPYSKPFSFLLLGLLFAAWLLAGCSGGKETVQERQANIQEALKAADMQLADGNTTEAIATLEALDLKYGNNPDILEALAFAYSNADRPTQAAFYFRGVFGIDNTRSYLLPYAAHAYEAEENWEEAAQTYALYLEGQPEDLPMWKALANAYSKLERPKDALDAYLDGMKKAGKQPNASEAIEIGNLFRSLGNQSQAERYYRGALQGDAGDRKIEALLGLFEIYTIAKDFEKAEEYAQQLNEVSPNAYKASDAYGPFIKFKEEERRKKLAEERKKKEEEEKKRLAEETERKKREAEEAKKNATVTITADGNTSMKPLETDTTGTVEIIEDPIPSEPTVDELIAESKALRDKNKFEMAVNLAWQAVNSDPRRADLWHELSQAYYFSGQFLEAEATASETTRLAPTNVKYRLSYLKIVQVSKPPNFFMQELRKANRDLPNSPDILLALARGYDKVENNARNAAYLYRQFIQKAPGHPERANVEQALRELDE